METVRLLRPRIDATLAPESVQGDTRTIEMQFYSGAAVRRYSWLRGEYLLSFSMDPAHVRLDQLNSGRAPLLESHSNWFTSDVLGVIEAGWLADGKGMARARFVKGDEAADKVWNKVQQGVLKNVSMGVAIHKLKETSKEEDKIKSYLAIDWEPQEISVVPIGADPGAQMLTDAVAKGMRREQMEAEEVEIEVLREPDVVRASAQEERAMDRTITAGAEARTETTNQDAVRQAQLAERQRVLDINEAARQFAELSPGANVAPLAASHIESGAPVEQFRAAALAELARQSAENPTRQHRTEVTRDQRDTVRLNAGAVVSHLMARGNAVEAANPFRGMGVLRLAEELLNATGRPTRGMGRAQIAELSMHATADFPLILADSARKQMLNAYAVAAPTYKLWTKASTTPDFKTMSRLRLSETPSFLKVPEGAQITLGTMTESREQYALATYGRGVSFTRQMLINDDLGAFNDLLSAFGQQAARLENKTVYAILNTNGNMADSAALFVAGHANLGTGAIGNTGLDAMFVAMATQKGLDGVTILNLAPKYLVVPAAKRATAEAAMTAVGPNVKASDQNWFAGRLTVVADGELDGTSTSVWYGAADPAIAPGIEYAHLDGAEGPQIIRKENEDAILGVQLYAYLDFAAKAVDWRPLYKSSGV